MRSTFPSDAQIKAYIERKISTSTDHTQLSRTIVKDAIAKKFRLSPEEREMLNEDRYYKTSIKTWIQEALNALPLSSSQRSDITIKASQEEKPSKSINLPPQKIEYDDVKIKAEAPQRDSPVRKRTLKVKKESSPEIKEEDEKDLAQSSSLEKDDIKPAAKRLKKEINSTKSTSAIPNWESQTPLEGNVEKKVRKNSPSSSSSSKSAASKRQEAKSKKLKKLVLLSGTRRPFKKLFDQAGCPNDGASADSNTADTTKKQIEVIEQTLISLGMTPPFTEAKASEIQRKKEYEHDQEVIRQANTTEKRMTRSVKEEEAKASYESELDFTPLKEFIIAPTKTFTSSLAKYAAELND